MSIKLAKLRCPRCGKSLGIPRKLAGTTSPCPKCGESFSIADDMSRLISLGPPPADEEPIVPQATEANEPPLALSVEKQASSRFTLLLAVIGGVTILTLLIIGGVVMTLPPSAPTSPAQEAAPTEDASEEAATVESSTVESSATGDGETDESGEESASELVPPVSSPDPSE